MGYGLTYVVPRCLKAAMCTYCMQVYLRAAGRSGGIGGSGWSGLSSMASRSLCSVILRWQKIDQQLKRRLWARAETVND